MENVNKDGTHSDIEVMDSTQGGDDDVLRTDTLTRKRTISNMEHDENVLDDFSDPPTGVHPLMWEMLKAIKRDTATTRDDVKCIDDRVLILEDQNDHIGTELSNLKANLTEVREGFKTLAGRLIRAETIIDRQQQIITDLKMRGMRDNVIIRSTGDNYKDQRNENTASVFKSFVTRELHVADAEHINIVRAHRMGQANENNNKMIIAKVPAAEDQFKIFSNASALRNTGHSISKQIPPEVEERKQFAWQEYKQLREAKRAPRFDGGRLIVDNEPISKYEPLTLPQVSSALMGLPKSNVSIGASDVNESGEHQFRAWAIPTIDLHGVREGLDLLLQREELARAQFASYAFRFKDNNGQYVENFHSDNDNGMGLAILKTLRNKDAMDIAVYVSHMGSHKSLPMKRKILATKEVVSGALLALINLSGQHE